MKIKGDNNILRFFYISGWSAGLADKSLVLLYRPKKLKRPKTKVKSSLKTWLNQEQPAKPQWLGHYHCVLSCLRRGSRQLTFVYKVVLHIPQIFLHPVVSDWACHRIYRKLLTTNMHPKLYIHLKRLHEIMFYSVAYSTEYQIFTVCDRDATSCPVSINSH